MKSLIFFLISSLVFFSTSTKKKDFIGVLDSFCVEFELVHHNKIDFLIIDRSIHIGNFSDCMHPDENFIVETTNLKYKVSAVKNIFYYDYSNWILIRDCEISSETARLFYQVILNDTIKISGNCHFVFESDQWMLTNCTFDLEDRKFMWSDLIDAYKLK
jgi:hypothetical protein